MSARIQRTDVGITKITIQGPSKDVHRSMNYHTVFLKIKNDGETIIHEMIEVFYGLLF